MEQTQNKHGRVNLQTHESSHKILLAISYQVTGSANFDLESLGANGIMKNALTFHS